MHKHIAMVTLSCLLLVSNTFADPLEEQIQEFMDKIYVIQGLLYVNKEALHSAETQKDIANLKAQIDAFSKTILEDGSLSKAELVRLEDQIAQCILALDALQK